MFPKTKMCFKPILILMNVAVKVYGFQFDEYQYFRCLDPYSPISVWKKKYYSFGPISLFPEFDFVTFEFNEMRAACLTT